MALTSEPRLFISYSWTSPPHKQWVLRLATDLRKRGVDVILDQWDLQLGQDVTFFMEQMVNEETKKVAIICDKKYSEKADGRDGGVGTETQIISKEVYDNHSQVKFAAVVRETNTEGTAYLPTYLKSRSYIDFSQDDFYEAKLHELLSWIFEEPLLIKPEIGKRVQLHSEPKSKNLASTLGFSKCLQTIKDRAPTSEGAFDEYCISLLKTFDRFTISNVTGELDDAIFKFIQDFLPLRNEVVEIFIAIARYLPTQEFTSRLHRLFERLILYMDPRPGTIQIDSQKFDHFRFIVHELFLNLLAAFLKYERFEQINFLFDQRYYLDGRSDRRDGGMVGFPWICRGTTSLDHRNKRLALRRLSLRADLLKERCEDNEIEFRHLAQADFVAFMRYELREREHQKTWWPETLVFYVHCDTPFEIFARCVSKAFFDRAKIILAIDQPQDLLPLMQIYRNVESRLPMWEFSFIYPSALVGFEKLATRA